MMQPRNSDRRVSGNTVLKSVMYRQYTENVAMIQPTMVLGMPCHTRVFDSRSYFFITASTSVCISSAGRAVWLESATCLHLQECENG